MKKINFSKYIIFIAFIIFVLVMFTRSKPVQIEIKDAKEDFVYLEENIKAIGNVKVTLAPNMQDTQIILKPIKPKYEEAYEPVYITHGQTIEFNTRKGMEYKLGVSSKSKDKVVLFKLKNVR